MISLRPFGMVLLALGACGPRPIDPEDIVWEPRVDEDEGFLCLTTEANPTIATLGVEPQRFEAGGPLGLHYDSALCLDGCNRNFEVDAVATLEGDGALVVSTTFRWETAPPQSGLLCALGCTLVDEVFALDPLPADGAYRLVWAGQERVFTVPSEDIVCLGTRAP